MLWDISYLLDSSTRISLGQLPYRDFPFAHAPLTFLLHAAILRVFGRVYFLHIACAAIEAGVATLLAWRILLGVLRPLAERAWGVAALLAAPLVFVGIYSIYPHPIYDSDCILAVLLALFLLQRAGDDSLRCSFAGAACVLPLFFKQNIGLPFLLITMACVAGTAILRRLQRVSIAPPVWTSGGVIVSLGAALLVLHATAGLHNYVYWTITFAAQRRLPGLGLILETYQHTLLLWTIPAAVAGLWLARRGSKRWMRAAAVLLLAAPFVWNVVSLALASDADDRADQLLSLWPHLLLLAGALAVWNLRPHVLRKNANFNMVLPLILLATMHGAFLSQQLWGSTYAIWPLLMLLIGAMLVEIPPIAGPLAIVVAATFLLCGGLYAASLERLSYIHLDGEETGATLPQLRGLVTRGPWIPEFEELVSVTNDEIPAGDAILLLPGEVPFYFATGRTPQFPVLLFDPATNPYTATQTLEEVRKHNVRWLIVTRNLQLNATPDPNLAEITRIVEQDFVLDRSLTNYDIYRRK